jgi:NADPH-dependent 2,4-dienoyl-CoA reductase/sulfur reductase-like enzyme
MPKRLLIVGGDAAGMSAAAKAKRTDSNGSVVVLEKGCAVSYAACGIPYFIAGIVPEAARLLARTPEQFAQQGIEVRLGHEALAIEPARKIVKVRDHQREREYEEPYDELLIATGAIAVKPPIEGADAPNAFTIRHYDDGIALKTFLQEHRPKRVTIIGAGYIGMEFAEAFWHLGTEVTVAEMLPQVFTGIDPDMATFVERELKEHGVVVRMGEPVIALQRDEKGFARQVVTPSATWETDLVLFGSSVKPNVALAQAAGIPLDETGAIATDERMHTLVEGIWAAGDCTSVVHLVTGKRVYIPLGPTANKQGRVAGENMAGGWATFAGVVGTAIAKVFRLAVARTGLTEKEAQREGLNFAAVTITAPDKAHYYPGAAPTTVKLIAEKGTGRLLGGQLVGPVEAAKRIDVLAAALHAHMTVDEVAQLDLSYAPPFAPVWDPLLVAAQQLRRQV